MGYKQLPQRRDELLLLEEKFWNCSERPTIEVIISQHLSLLYDICFKKVLFSIFQ